MEASNRIRDTSQLPFELWLAAGYGTVFRDLGDYTRIESGMQKRRELWVGDRLCLPARDFCSIMAQQDDKPYGPAAAPVVSSRPNPEIGAL